MLLLYGSTTLVVIPITLQRSTGNRAYLTLRVFYLGGRTRTCGAGCPGACKGAGCQSDADRHRHEHWHQISHGTSLSCEAGRDHLPSYAEVPLGTYASFRSTQGSDVSDDPERGYRVFDPSSNRGFHGVINSSMLFSSQTRICETGGIDAPTCRSNNTPCWGRFGTS